MAILGGGLGGRPKAKRRALVIAFRVFLDGLDLLGARLPEFARSMESFTAKLDAVRTTYHWKFQLDVSSMTASLSGVLPLVIHGDGAQQTASTLLRVWHAQGSRHSERRV